MTWTISASSCGGSGRNGGVEDSRAERTRLRVGVPKLDVVDTRGPARPQDTRRDGALITETRADPIDLRVAPDGDHHRSNRRQYVRDQQRLRKLEAMGWIIIRVIAEDAPEDIARRIRDALIRRGYRDT